MWCEFTLNNSNKASGSVVTIGIVYRSPNSEKESDNLLFSSIGKAAKVILLSWVTQFSLQLLGIDWIEELSGCNGIDFLDVQGCFLHQHVSFPAKGDSIHDLVFTSDPNVADNFECLGTVNL